ncbi:MAG TPA: hypothetical protein VGB91_14840 [Rhizomicrobium sp.]
MDELEGGERHIARNIWAICVAILVGPALMAWIVRLVALGMQCAPGPDPCRGLALGGGLRDALALTWSINGDTALLLAVAFVATIAGLFARRPLMAALTCLLLPLAALIVPMAAVFVSLYPGCTVSEAGIGSCELWGAEMGMSFHSAAGVQWQIYGFVPYTFAVALMLGVVGLFLMRPRPVGHATAHTRRFPEDRFGGRE